MTRNRSLGFGSFFALSMLCSCAPSSSGPELRSTQAALTADQCSYFNANGKDTICHATGSAKNPYVLVRTSEQGCINGHSSHVGDYIDVTGGTCNGQGCLPLNAPCDQTLPCCDGASCNNGTCTADTCNPDESGLCGPGQPPCCAPLVCSPGFFGSTCQPCVSDRGFSCGPFVGRLCCDGLTCTPDTSFYGFSCQ